MRDSSWAGTMAVLLALLVLALNPGSALAAVLFCVTLGLWSAGLLAGKGGHHWRHDPVGIDGSELLLKHCLGHPLSSIEWNWLDLAYSCERCTRCGAFRRSF